VDYEKGHHKKIVMLGRKYDESEERALGD